MVLGFGQTTMMSSQDITFAAGDGLEPSMEAQIAIAWPFLLDGRISLQLVLDATITGTQDGVAEARILAYDFRARTMRRAVLTPTAAEGLESDKLGWRTLSFD